MLFDFFLVRGNYHASKYSDLRTTHRRGHPVPSQFALEPHARESAGRQGVRHFAWFLRDALQQKEIY